MSRAGGGSRQLPQAKAQSVTVASGDDDEEEEDNSETSSEEEEEEEGGVQATQGYNAADYANLQVGMHQTRAAPAARWRWIGGARRSMGAAVLSLGRGRRGGDIWQVAAHEAGT